MPSGAQHRKLTRDFLGWDIPEVHRIMDAASAYLGGRHRVVGHNLRAFEAVELLFGRDGRIVATLHVLEDARIIVPKAKIIVPPEVLADGQLSLLCSRGPGGEPPDEPAGSDL